MKSADIVKIKEGDEGMKQKTRTVLRTVFMTFFVITLVLSATYFVAKADDNSRLISFGDERRALSFERTDTTDTLTFFGKTFSFDREKEKKNEENIVRTLKCAVPSVFRLVGKIFTALDV